ncbi:hypothetical protein [Chryseobacterium taiwanense]|uniref:Outer membrane protein beta-barrel domain-containing protein n=1 Tax=Chryseobacterium taiwanense TaxID=363331 RepID=A0A0B4CJB4_9FLAO|nr:hypothetical protein [Chryseobacterium taiwanense]KIC61329.1 hypothetical protein RM51_17770 [Chryseobacterium taiwanense]
MKKIISFIFVSMFTCIYAQEKESNKESFFGVQAGLFGVNIYNESDLSEQFTLRSEVDLTAGIWGGDLYSKTGFALAPSVSVTPKWYYNSIGRSNKNKNIKYNAANYLSAKLSYAPDWFVISNVDGIKVNPMISLVPTWGLRRNFAKNFNYELQLGLGVGKILKSDYDLQVVPNLSFRIGYDF